jgi:hypothetical protein
MGMETMLGEARMVFPKVVLHRDGSGWSIDRSEVVLYGALIPMPQEHTLTEADLAQFTGTMQHYQHPLGVRYTDGVKYLAEKGGAYWLLDAIASWQADSRIRDDAQLQEIQFWKLTVKQDRSATLVCERDEGDAVVTQAIPFTDFPLSKLTLYWQHGVVLLPSEY